MAFVIHEPARGVYITRVRKPSHRCAKDLWPEGVNARDLSRLNLPFANLDEAYESARRIADSKKSYLTPEEQTVLQNTVDALAHSSDLARDHIATLGQMITRAEVNLRRDFRTNVSRVTERLNKAARTARLNGDTERLHWLLGLLQDLPGQSRYLSFTQGARDWVRAFDEANFIEATHVPLRARDVCYSQIPRHEAAPTEGDFRFVLDLTALGPVEQRLALQHILEDEYAHPWGIQREVRRAAADGPKYRKLHAFVADLNQALSFFLEPPRPLRRQSKAELIGPVLVKGQPTLVSVRFDTRRRYFTIQVNAEGRHTNRYYQAIVAPDGVLRILDDPPLVNPATRTHRLFLNHFAY